MEKRITAVMCIFFVNLRSAVGLWIVQSSPAGALVGKKEGTNLKEGTETLVDSLFWAEICRVIWARVIWALFSAVYKCFHEQGRRRTDHR